MSKLNIVLDATMLDTFQVCPEKFNLRFNKNKVTPVKATALDRGSLVHTGFEHYYTSLMKGMSFEESLEKMTAAIRLAGVESDLDPSICQRTLDVLTENVTYYKNTDLSYQIKAVEHPFAYELFEDEVLKIIMIGKIDLLVDTESYVNLPIDHKSYDREYPTMRMTNQFRNYVYATNSQILLVNKVGFQTSLTAEKKYKRVPLSYDQLCLEQWKQNVIKWVYIYIDCVANDSWPLNETSCNKFNRLCEYYDVCDASGWESKLYKLETQFKTDTPWDVAKSLGLNQNEQK